MGRTTGLLIACCKCNAPQQEGAWAKWYDDEHLPDLLRGGGGPSFIDKPEPSS